MNVNSKVFIKYVIIAFASVCWLGIFFVLAPWIAAEPIENATSEIKLLLHNTCGAFVINHGSPACFNLGTKQQNPIGFWSVLICFLIPIFLIGLSKIKAYLNRRNS